MRTVEPHEAVVGASVVWMHTPRGGYGYAIPVNAQIAALSHQGDRAVIEAVNKAGEVVRRNVKISSLRVRT